MENSVRTDRAAESSRVNLAVGLAAAAYVLWIALIATDADGPIWLGVALLGAAAAVIGWRSADGARPTGRARVAAIAGAVAFVSVIVFTIVLAATGEL